ncbi:MAG: amidohydrolase family protein [Lautropia sp.]
MGGPDMARRFQDAATASLKGRVGKVAWWSLPSGPQSMDRAMAMLPRLFHSRLDHMGIDFAHLFPTRGLTSVYIRDDEVRQASCRALNLMYRDMFRGTQDRLRPVAIVPTFTPAEAIAELDFAVRELDFKAVLIGTEIRRPDPDVVRDHPELAPYSDKCTSIVMDAPHDYDPLWQRFCDLGVTPMAHTAGMGTRAHGYRSSSSNYVFNHIGGFASGAEFFCRGLFFGGVTRRFPQLTFGLMEGGVAWAQTLINDIVEHWEKRNIDALLKNLSPAGLDVDLLGRMFDQWGDARLTGEGIRASPHHFLARPEAPALLDEFAACGMQELGDLQRLFIDRFYFGCEADDRMIAVAFNRRLNPLGLPLHPVLGSDIGHWDVMDASSILSECYSLVQGRLLTQDDFRQLTFVNPARMHLSMNPRYFEGTVVADATQALAAPAEATP